LIRKAFLGLTCGFAALCHGQITYTISTYAGTSGTRGFAGDGGAASAAQLAGPAGLAFDNSGTLYIVDQFNQRVRTVAAGGGNITSVAGNGTAGYNGDGKAATSANISGPVGVAVDGSGNVYIGDTNNDVIRKVSGGNISTYTGIQNLGGGFGGDGGAIASGRLDQPTNLAIDSAGNLYIADTLNHRIRKISGGNINTVAGFGPPGFSGDGGSALSATLDTPRGLCLDAAGNIYFADSANNRIRRVGTDGNITTVAGKGDQGFGGDNGLATLALLNRPIDVAVDKGGNLYIADYNNARIRRVAANGIITTIAGNGKFGFSGDGGPALSATIGFPSALAVDPSGNVYFSDAQNSVVRVLTPAATAGGKPVISSGGVIGASSYGAFTTIAPAGWIEIYGQNLGFTTRSWGTADFIGNNAPTFLDGTRVTIGGQNAFVEFVSPGQVNAQVPSTVPPGQQAVVVSTTVGASTAFNVNVAATQPGIFAPAAFKIGAKQYAGAVFNGTSTFAIPANAVAGVSSRPAKPGDTIQVFGVGFGPVVPDTPAGQIAVGQTTLATAVSVTIGGAAAAVGYSGLAPGAVGLYQFNVTVPNVPNGDAALAITVGGTAIPQNLVIAVQN
jgi:uncharacterized protein (TIGR03437 family)